MGFHTRLRRLPGIILAIALCSAGIPGRISQAGQLGPTTPASQWPSVTLAPADANSIASDITGGPDQFGYTWASATTITWIDVASSGIDTGMSGYSHQLESGPISLPFAFPYYEHTYNTLYIAASGYLGFSDSDYWPSQLVVPSPELPHAIIAPYASTFSLSAAGPEGRVYYGYGGAAPERYFVAEWYKVAYEGSVYTFEVILYESGEIVFQYLAMQYGVDYRCGYVGIENSTGWDGLAFLSDCHKIASNTKVTFSRPEPAARCIVWPRYQGQFAHPNAPARFEIPIENAGDLGPDVFDLSIVHTWPISLFQADGVTPLTDTDLDGAIDTGPIAAGEVMTAILEMRTPYTANIGDADRARVTIRSSLDPVISVLTVLAASMPAPFAHVAMHADDAALRLHTYHPQTRTAYDITTHANNGYNSAITDLPNGNFALIWSRPRMEGSIQVTELEYTIREPDGPIIRGISQLTAYPEPSLHIYDGAPAPASAQNGNIAVLWLHEMVSPTTYLTNKNVYFAVMDAQGNVILEPTNLSGNTIWGMWLEKNVPNFDSPRVVNTTDDRFVLVWHECHLEDTGPVGDIYIQIRNPDGSVIMPTLKYTHDTAGYDIYHSEPTLAALEDRRVLIAWNTGHEVVYVVLDSDGNTIKSETTIPVDGKNLASTQVRNNRSLIAMTIESDVDYDEIAFALLDGATYDVIVTPQPLSHPSTLADNAYVSVTSDAVGHAILTWMEMEYTYQRFLSYALVDSEGQVLTPPMIFQSSRNLAEHINTSDQSHGSAPYSAVQPQTMNADVVLAAPQIRFSAKDGVVTIPIALTNNGAAIAAGIILTATLDTSLVFVEATPTPISAAARSVVWHLPDLSWLGMSQVTLRLGTPSAPVGTHYGMTWAVSTTSDDAFPDNNTGATEIYLGAKLFIPQVMR